MGGGSVSKNPWRVFWLFVGLLVGCQSLRACLRFALACFPLSFARSIGTGYTFPRLELLPVNCARKFRLITFCWYHLPVIISLYNPAKFIR